MFKLTDKLKFTVKLGSIFVLLLNWLALYYLIKKCQEMFHSTGIQLLVFLIVQTVLSGIFLAQVGLEQLLLFQTALEPDSGVGKVQKGNFDRAILFLKAKILAQRPADRVWLCS